MLKRLLFLSVALLVLYPNPSIAESPNQTKKELGLMISELTKEENERPTSKSNVEDRFARLIEVVRGMMMRSLPADKVLSKGDADAIKDLIRKGELDKAASMVSEAIRRLSDVKDDGRGKPSDKCGDGVCDDFERSRPELCPKDCKVENSSETQAVPAIPQMTTGVIDDAEKMMWGTECGIFISNTSNLTDRQKNQIDVVNHVLGVKYVKIRIQIQMVLKDGGFTQELCLPSQKNCRIKYSLDETTKLFKANNWSMIPMLSNDTTAESITEGDIERYVDFVDWFVTRYRTQANIKYLELLNDPNRYWKGSHHQLLELNNKTYDRIKNKYPDIKVGTPGFEYWADAPETDQSVTRIDFFLDKKNGAKFDFWAYHGYPSIKIDSLRSRIPAFYPPTKSPATNKYAGVRGILEIRRRLDANCWSDREIIDAEHVNLMSQAKPFISEDEDKTDAAFTVQELTLKRTLKKDGKLVLSGIIALKTIPRGESGEFLFASLRPDSSLTHTVSAVSLFRRSLAGYRHSSHISGEFDREDQPWVEEFRQDNKRLFIFFKPFQFNKDGLLKLDEKPLTFKIDLGVKPKSIGLTDLSGSRKEIPPAQVLMLDARNEPGFLEVTL